MGIKSIITTQYRQKVNQAASLVEKVTVPPEGWLRTVRKALGMSAAQLARRLGKSRALVSNTEKAELEDRVTLKTMKVMAEAMNCRFVYAIVPENNIESVLQVRAQNKAQQRVSETSKHMALEQQSLSQEQIAFERDRLASGMLKNMPADFWNDEV